jgi:nucleotide-binding universal stress UspA family protein
VRHRKRRADACEGGNFAATVVAILLLEARMSRIEQILVAVDFEQPSEHALAYAMDLAEALGAKVHVIIAYELPTASVPGEPAVITPEMVSRFIEASQLALDKVCAAYRDRMVVLSSRVEEGYPREVILKVAREKHANLIVMGTHGRKGFARLLIGSVAEAVLRTAEVPVVTVH